MGYGVNGDDAVSSADDASSGVRAKRPERKGWRAVRTCCTARIAGSWRMRGERMSGARPYLPTRAPKRYARQSKHAMNQ